MYPGLYQSDADIIVIGAGLSGLTAAYTILEKEPNLSVMVFEANSRKHYSNVAKSLTTFQIFNRQIWRQTFIYPIIGRKWE